MNQKTDSNASDLGLLLNFINELGRYNEKEAMISKCLEFFQILFSPKVLQFYQFNQSNQGDRENVTLFELINFQFKKNQTRYQDTVPSIQEQYRWFNSKNGLDLAIWSGSQIQGVLKISEFAHPEYIKRYLPVILLLGKFWSLSFERMNYITEIQAEHERFQIVADHSKNWEFWYDDSGNFHYNSPSCQSITGYNIEEFSNFYKFLEKILHHLDKRIWQAYIYNLHTDNQVMPIDFRIIHKTGAIRWFQMDCHKIYNSSHQFLGFRGSIVDITSRKEAQEKVIILQGMLPICSVCKKIRSDKGYWEQIESYIREHSEAEFTHSLCPDCLKKEYGIEF